MLSIIRFIVFPVIALGALFQTFLYGPFMAGMDLAYNWLYSLHEEEMDEED